MRHHRGCSVALLHKARDLPLQGVRSAVIWAFPNLATEEEVPYGHCFQALLGVAHYIAIFYSLKLY